MVHSRQLMCQVENTKMTRREALLRAIKYIGDNDPELTHKLNEMIEDMPMTHWSAAACYDAIEDFYITHGRFPRMEDFKRSSKLPTLPTIRNRFHMPALQWLRSLEHYTPARTNSALVAFIDEYNRIHPVSGPDYNIKKCKDVSRWEAVARRYTPSGNWTDLLKLTGLRSVPRRHIPEYQVDATGGIWAIDERLQALEQKLYEA